MLCDHSGKPDRDAVDEQQDEYGLGHPAANNLGQQQRRVRKRKRQRPPPPSVAGASNGGNFYLTVAGGPADGDVAGNAYDPYNTVVYVSSSQRKISATLKL